MTRTRTTLKVRLTFLCPARQVSIYPPARYPMRHGNNRERQVIIEKVGVYGWVGDGLRARPNVGVSPVKPLPLTPHLGRLQSDLAFLVMINASQCNVHQKRHSLFSTRQFPQISICVSADQSGVNSLTPGRPDTCLTTAPACTRTPWR